MLNSQDSASCLSGVGMIHHDHDEGGLLGQANVLRGHFKQDVILGPRISPASSVCLIEEYMWNK